MKVSVGQRLEEREPPHRLWEIVRIVRPEHGFPHARLRLTDDHATTVMLSCAALESGQAYRPAEGRQVVP